MKIEVSFPGGVEVDAHFHGYSIHTDQPEKAGGRGSGPAPFDLFLASLATCSGYYAVRFCRERDIEIRGLGITLEPIREPETRRLVKIRLGMTLPEHFPAKYKKAIVRAVDQCTVKRCLLDPPEVETELVHALSSS